MKHLYRTLVFVMCSFCLLPSCKKNLILAPDKDKYIYDIPQTNLKADAIVGAYYLNYTSAVSDKAAETPMLGYYKTSDPGVMSHHIEWADIAALDFFIFTWNGSSSDNALVDSFRTERAASDGKVKFVYCYNTSHLKVTNDLPLQREAKYKEFLGDFIDVLADNMLSDDYYCIDGRPVIFITPANLGSDELLSIDFKAVMEKFRADFKSFYGVEPYVVGQMTTGWVAPVNYADHQVYSFDAMTLNAWKTRSYDLFYGYFSFLDINWNNWKTTLAKRDVDFVPCIYPSYNDRKYSKDSYYYTFGNEGKTDDFVKFCNVAKRNIGSKNMVLVNSWNDWNYGTNLEPSEEKSQETGEGDVDYFNFLRTAKQQFKVAE